MPWQRNSSVDIEIIGPEAKKKIALEVYPAQRLPAT